MTHQISSTHLDFKKLKEIIDSGVKLELSQTAIHKIQSCRDYIDRKLAGSNTAYYGINTGFGALYDKSISVEDLEQLQLNLVMSHACGTGERVPDESVRLMLFLKIQSCGLVFQ